MKESTADSVQRSLEEFRASIAADPTFAPAYAGLASAHTDLGTVRHYRQAEEVHGDLVLRLIDGTRIRAARFKALIDGNGGAGGPLGRRLLQSLAV